MIGIITLIFFCSWFWIAHKITKLITKKSGFPFVVIYLMILALPFADEIVGRAQFQILCDNEAKVWVSPTANEVTAAKKLEKGITTLSGYAFRIREQSVTYIDANTGEEFYKFKAFHTPGGWIMRSGLNLGHSTSCWPSKWSSRENGIDIDLLLKNGKNISK